MYAYIPDILLILVSGSACLYCFLLSRRLKQLQSLECGLGASILTLTDAITKTNEAAQHARLSTEKSIVVLEQLLRDAHDAMPQVEARIESLRYSRIAAQTVHTELNNLLTSEIKPELQNARQTSQSLLKIVAEVTKFQHRTQEKQKQKIKRKILKQAQSLKQGTEA